MSTETIHIAGRYNKYLRNLSQSPWFDKDDVRVMDSVQEMLEDGLKKYLQFEKTTFASSGREDVDVRMLGKGRPFAFRLHNPGKVSDYNNETLKLVQKYINDTHKGKVHVRDLQMVTKLDVAKHLKEGQESKRKEYRALCCCSRKITLDDIEKINSITDLRLEQMTPIRVLHRRTWATRQRTIHRLKIERVQVSDFESVKPDILDHVFAVTLLTEAGTYIKEFVHGDFGRTEPNLSSLLGDCDTDLMELDVMEVHSDWPQPLADATNESTMNQASASLAHQDDKMDCGDEALADLYSHGLKALQDALNADRGDHKESLLVESRRSLERAAAVTESLSLFSDNETLEDIATVNLKYLLLPAYLAKLSISGDIGSRRLQAFARAESYIKQFLRRIAVYRLGNKAVSEAVKSFDDPSAPKVPTSLEGQAMSRAEKIEQYNKAKELETKLAELERRLKSGQEVDDEVAREYYTSLIDKWIHETLDDFNGIVRPALVFERGGPGARQDPPPSSRPRLPDSLEGKTFTITKDQLKKQVFGSGYPALPTVSVDEFISKKIKDGDLAFESHKEIYANSLQRYAEQPNLRAEQEEQSDEERDAKEERDDSEELAKKRRWDEFKDENPRGSGNRHNMG